MKRILNFFLFFVNPLNWVKVLGLTFLFLVFLPVGVRVGDYMGWDRANEYRRFACNVNRATNRIVTPILSVASSKLEAQEEKREKEKKGVLGFFSFYGSEMQGLVKIVLNCILFCALVLFLIWAAPYILTIIKWGYYRLKT